MHKEIFYMGILAGMTFMQGMMTWNIRQKKKPYIIVFACLMFWEAAIVVTEGLLYNFGGWSLPVALSAGIDYFVIPMFYVEVLCLAYQDMKIFSWRKRCLQGGIVAIPLVINLCILIATGKEVPTTESYIFGIAYTAVIFALVFYHLRNFHKLLQSMKDEKRKEEQGVTWVITIVLLTILQYVIYMIYDLLPDPIIYYAVSYLIIGLHGHYIRKQVPADIKKLKAMSEEILEQRQEAIDDLKDATEGLRQKIDMDTAIKAFRVMHPSFDTRLRNLTETKLTQRDIMLCCLIYEGKRIPEIADHLGISPASVEVARHRLRNKLNLERGVNMNHILKVTIEGK